MTMSMAESTGIKKAVLYDVSLADKIEEGKSILLTNYTVSIDSVMVNTKSKVANTSEVMVDRERERQARELIYPPTSPFVNIKEALAMPVGSMLLTKGLIVETEEAPAEIEMLTVEGFTLQEEDVLLVCTDESGDIKDYLCARYLVEALFILDEEEDITISMSNILPASVRVEIVPGTSEGSRINNISLV
ncbi:unnamed protein product [Mytilus edulis]|uniref:Uncharacterized protein n=1 Tax=Mytilus edulis TaxID=6550 RepID=A0A8S3REV3_MYTED|nr:unnamed protein product [Mytilus edulis]